MKNNVDRLYDRITGNMIRQRRLISILLVLSILVSSGVLWGLRDTGISMANDAECGIEEHIHTDECYGDILVCGYDDDGELAEDEVEYQYVRTCGLEESDEHTHDMDCFGFVYAAGGRNDAAAEGAVAADEITADAEETGEEIRGTEEDASEGIDVSEDAVKHVHTAECYARGVICGKEEHDHVYSCYFGDVPEEDEEEYDPFDNGGVVLLNSDVDDEIEFFDADEMMVGDGDGSGSTLPGTITTIDNIAEGIRFNLFDYFGPELERNNNFDVRKVDDKWVHDSISYTGINTGRNYNDDILFFEYGTPDFIGQTGNINLYERTLNSAGKLNPSKNNYSGDYNSLPEAYLYSYQFKVDSDYTGNKVSRTEKDRNGNDITVYYSKDYYDAAVEKLKNNPEYLSDISGNRPVQEIVKNTLASDGYPVMNNDAAHSLSYLFKPENVADQKTVWENVNHILKKEGSHLLYDSNENYAYFNQDTKDFTVYDRTYYIVNDAHHFAGDYNNLTDTRYDTSNGYPFMIGFFPFDQYDESRQDPNFNGNGFNHHFGMTMEASFNNSQPAGSTEPIMFSYSGDDDMWVFVDGKLVLDVGGIHEPAAGMIDFTNGLVWIQDNYLGKPWSELGYQGDQYARPKNYDGIKAYDKINEQYVTTETKWIVKPISEFLGDNWNSNTKHDIKMFYLERGGCYSNLAMDMNLPTVKNLVVTKDIDKGTTQENYFDSKEYYFRVMEKDSNGNFVVPSLGENVSNEFTLRAGGRKIFSGLDSTKEYVVQEYNIETGVFSNVKINEKIYPCQGTITSDAHRLDSVSLYEFTNVVSEQFTGIKVKKEWSDSETNPHSSDVVKFKLYRTDSYYPDNPRPVAIKEKDVYGNIKTTRTFLLSSSNGWEKTFSNLPTRYGDHIYTYSVVEQNVPMGYKASYSTDEDGTLVISNTDVSKVDIFVKKEWENVVPGQEPEINLTLRRRYVGYSESKKTRLTVNLQSENGTVINTFTTDKVYVGGSIEFSLDAPKGVEYYAAGENGHVCTPSTLGFSYADEVFEISDLAENSNTVDIKVTTNNAEDSIMLLHHSFTQSQCGWTEQGMSEYVTNTSSNENVKSIITSGYNSYAKNDALLVRNRTEAWHGAKLQLDPMKFKANKTYTFSLYVYSGVATQFKMTFNDGLNKEDAKSFHQVSVKNVESGKWTQLSGTVTLPEDINPYGMFILIETSSFDYSEFRMDEFIAVEGKMDISVAQNTGIVSIGGEFNITDYNVNQNGFKEGELDGWEILYGNTCNIKVTKESNTNIFLEVYNRNGQNYAGATRDVNLIPGIPYSFNFDISGGGTGTTGDNYVPATDRTFKLTLKYTKNNENDGYATIATASIAKDGDEQYQEYKWTTLKNSSFYLPADADASKKMQIYIETPTSNNQKDNHPYRIYSCNINHNETVVSGNKDGYTYDAVNKIYQSNSDRFSVSFDDLSATNPLHLEGEYTDDNWSNTITLNKDEGWTYHWDKQALGEESNRLYQYYIEENVLNSDYIVTYKDSYVATNTADTPIIVHNKYIWYRLPATGGRGTTIYFIGGIAFILLGITGAVIINRRRSKKYLNLS